jgi:hypothetical protein
MGNTGPNKGPLSIRTSINSTKPYHISTADYNLKYDRNIK